MGKTIPITDAEYNKVVQAFLSLNNNTASALSKHTGIKRSRVDTIISRYLAAKKVTK